VVEVVVTVTVTLMMEEQLQLVMEELAVQAVEQVTMTTTHLLVALETPAGILLLKEIMAETVTFRIWSMLEQAAAAAQAELVETHLAE